MANERDRDSETEYKSKAALMWVVGIISGLRIDCFSSHCGSCKCSEIVCEKKNILGNKYLDSIEASLIRSSVSLNPNSFSRNYVLRKFQAEYSMQQYAPYTHEIEIYTVLAGALFGAKSF